jgi:hypothetical protein
MDTIEGTWRLVRAIARDDVGNLRPSPYDGHGMGRIVIGGRMAVMMIDWRHDVPGGQKREYSGYTGTYTYDGKQLITTVDAAPDPGRIGTKQARGARFENGVMILIPPSRVVDAVTEHREIRLGEGFGRLTVSAVHTTAVRESRQVVCPDADRMAVAPRFGLFSKWRTIPSC